MAWRLNSESGTVAAGTPPRVVDLSKSNSSHVRSSRQARARRTASNDALLLRRKTLQLRSAARFDEAKLGHPVPILAVRLQPLVFDRAPGEVQQLLPTLTKAESPTMNKSVPGTEKRDSDEAFEEGRTAEAVIPQAELQAWRSLWNRSRKKFWARVSAQVSSDLSTTLRQATELCTRSAKRVGECHLSLCNRRLGDEGAHVLGLVLGMGDISLTSINLFGNTSDTGPITPVGFGMIADAIHCHQNQLQKIVISRNTALGDGGIALLADALSTTVALTHLDISNTGCGDAGMIAIAVALGRMQTGAEKVKMAAATSSSDEIPGACAGANLSELILCGNDAIRGSSSWSALARVLPQLYRLRRLDCSRCMGLRCDGADAIAAVLLKCIALESLSVARCAIGDRGGLSLAKAVATAESRGKQWLASLDVSWNRLTGERVKDIVNAGAGVGWDVVQTPGGFWKRADEM